ncbi:hypothetical protein SCLCIDRAFT_1212429 [Scleroderma citrinum Foug A]|uniref:Uncharacterized protein n=1 Tax=Scleroderma citrinum Foug A TaxID=1036808 RepID=A0A0C3EBC5_9AGAM|nr:hypothetical protein SCLCIDRAFT_1212429 [Scleroderma citrinum Foug A]
MHVNLRDDSSVNAIDNIHPYKRVIVHIHTKARVSYQTSCLGIVRIWGTIYFCL